MTAELMQRLGLRTERDVEQVRAIASALRRQF